LRFYKKQNQLIEVCRKTFYFISLHYYFFHYPSFILNACQTSTRATAPSTTETPADSLREQIQKIVSSKNAVVGVAIIGNHGKDTISFNGDKHFPMQSMFKFHIALAVLSEVDKGKFSIDQPIKIEKKDLLLGLYSPLRDKYPEGVTLSLGEIIKDIVSLSDNVGCDLLLRLMGGPHKVEEYFKKK
jgi:beta-lactamase class A